MTLRENILFSVFLPSYIYMFNIIFKENIRLNVFLPLYISTFDTVLSTYCEIQRSKVFKRPYIESLETNFTNTKRKQNFQSCPTSLYLYVWHYIERHWEKKRRFSVFLISYIEMFYIIFQRHNEKTLGSASSYLLTFMCLT